MERAPVDLESNIERIFGEFRTFLTDTAGKEIVNVRKVSRLTQGGTITTTLIIDTTRRTTDADRSV